MPGNPVFVFRPAVMVQRHLQEFYPFFYVAVFILAPFCDTISFI